MTDTECREYAKAMLLVGDWPLMEESLVCIGDQAISYKTYGSQRDASRQQWFIQIWHPNMNVKSALTFTLPRDRAHAIELWTGNISEHNLRYAIRDIWGVRTW